MPKILVADDDAIVLQMVRTTLSRGGHEVLSAEDGEAALTLALVEAPQLVILDRNMPGLDGHETLRRLRADEKTSKIPVLMITGLRTEADVRLSLSLGAQGYLAKPFAPTDLISRVDRLLSPKIARKR